MNESGRQSERERVGVSTDAVFPVSRPENDFKSPPTTIPQTPHDAHRLISLALGSRSYPHRFAPPPTFTILTPWDAPEPNLYRLIRTLDHPFPTIHHYPLANATWCQL